MLIFQSFVVKHKRNKILKNALYKVSPTSFNLSFEILSKCKDWRNFIFFPSDKKKKILKATLKI